MAVSVNSNYHEEGVTLHLSALCPIATNLHRFQHEHIKTIDRRFPIAASTV